MQRGGKNTTFSSISALFFKCRISCFHSAIFIDSFHPISPSGMSWKLLGERPQLSRGKILAVEVNLDVYFGNFVIATRLSLYLALTSSPSGTTASTVNGKEQKPTAQTTIKNNYTIALLRRPSQRASIGSEHNRPISSSRVTSITIKLIHTFKSLDLIQSIIFLFKKSKILTWNPKCWLILTWINPNLD